MLDPKELKRIADRLYEICDEMGGESEKEDSSEDGEYSEKKSKSKKGMDSGKKSAIMSMLQKKAKKGE